MSITESIRASLTVFARLGIKVSASAKIFGVGADAETSLEVGFETTLESSYEASHSHTVTSEQTYEIRKKIITPPYTKLKVLSYVNWIDDLTLNYKAKLHVYGTGPTFMENPNLDVAAINSLLAQKNFKERKIDQTSHSVIYQVKGQLKGSFGLDSIFSVSELPSVSGLNSLARSATEKIVIFERIPKTKANNAIKEKN